MLIENPGDPHINPIDQTILFGGDKGYFPHVVKPGYRTEFQLDSEQGLLELGNSAHQGGLVVVVFDKTKVSFRERKKPLTNEREVPYEILLFLQSAYADGFTDTVQSDTHIVAFRRNAENRTPNT